MLQELRVSEMRYRAVLEVLDGAVISGVARRYGAPRKPASTREGSAVVLHGSRRGAVTLHRFIRQ